jgi:selenocysteine lyase/cysteine desulfurase
MEGRVPTFLINVAGVPAGDVAVRLAGQNMGVWAHDSWYSLGLYRQLGYENDAVRLGFIHYNTSEEVDALVAALNAMAG